MIWQDIAVWHRDAFPTATEQDIFTKLVAEVGELGDDVVLSDKSRDARQRNPGRPITTPLQA